nr:hypothetical protein [Streptomyces chartreusis]
MATATATRPASSGGAFAGHVGDTLALAGRHLTHLRRSPGRLILVTMNPLVMLIAVGYLFRNSMQVPEASPTRTSSWPASPSRSA